MGKMFHTRMGVRLGRARARDSQFGPGKVHLLIWRRDMREWVTHCRFDDPWWSAGWERVSVDHEVTCKECVKQSPVLGSSL